MSGRRYLVLASPDAPLPSQLVTDLAAATGLAIEQTAYGGALLIEPIRARSGRARAGEGGGVSPSTPATGARPDRTAIEAGRRPGDLTVSMTDRGVSVTRDPAGAAPCIWCRTPGLVMAASDPATLAGTGLWRPSVSWTMLAFSLYAAALPATNTALEGCQELPPGFSLEIGRAATIALKQTWSPWEHVASALGDEQDAAHRLEQAVLEAVSGIADGSDHVLIGVSGGLDSSIVAAATVACGKQATCFTIATQAPDGDERVYARALTDHLGLPLIEARYTLADIDLDRVVAANVPRPVARTHEQSYYQQAANALAESGADMLFTGNGGDALFCLTMSAVALSDRLLAHGPGRRALRTVRDICELTGAAPGAVIRAALRRLRRRDRRYLWRCDRSFVPQAMLETLDARPLDHPWLETPRSGLPGRAVHIAMLLRVQQAIASQVSVPTAHPLMTRSVLEIALGIPTWSCVAGGADRAVARRAFAHRLPAAVVARRIKGGPDSFAVELIEQLRDSIAERLLDGRLAGHGVIDRAAVEAALRRFGPGQRLDHVRLLQLLEAENWAAHWEAASVQFRPVYSTRFEPRSRL